MNLQTIPSSFFEIPVGFMVREKDSRKYNIELPIQPFIFDEEEMTTSIRLDKIDFRTANLNYLAEKTFEFPINPQPGYIDGSVYLGGIHNSVDVTKISFSKLLNYKEMSLVSVIFEMDYLFELIELENIHKIIKTNVIIFNGF